MNTSHCIYCESTSFGSPCLFSPTNTHVHMSANQCIYCGSKESGGGCLLNPYNKIHVKGPEFLNRSNIQTEKAIILKYLLNKLQIENYTQDYKSPLDRFYHRVAAVISQTAEPFLDALALNEASVYSSLTKPQMINALDCKDKFTEILRSLNQAVKEANLILPPEIVEESLKDAILKLDED